MSLSDLEKMKLLRPREEWSGRSERSLVQPLAAAGVALLGVMGCILMIVGDGGRMTWVGLLMFTVALGAFTWINLRGICRDT